MRTSKFISVLALMLTAGLAAADHHMTEEKPSFFASQSMTVTATVEAINHETREVTLRRDDDTTVTFTASEEARNLPQVTAGDTVTAEYVESVSIVVVANDGMEAGAGEMAAMARTKKGEMPGVAAMDKKIVTATVEEINIEANTFKLKGPDGTIEEYVARNPENLKRADVGDLVIMEFTEAMAITVQEHDAE